MFSNYTLVEKILLWIVNIIRFVPTEHIGTNDCREVKSVSYRKCDPVATVRILSTLTLEAFQWRVKSFCVTEFGVQGVKIAELPLQLKISLNSQLFILKFMDPMAMDLKKGCMHIICLGQGQRYKNLWKSLHLLYNIVYLPCTVPACWAYSYNSKFSLSFSKKLLGYYMSPITYICMLIDFM